MNKKEPSLLLDRLSNTKIHKTGGNTIILERPGIVKNNVKLAVKTRNGRPGLIFKVSGKPLTELWSDTNAAPLNELNEVRIQEVIQAESVLERTPTFYNHLYEGKVFVDQKPTDKFDPNGTREWFRKIERIHQANRETCTVGDVVIDPENVVLKDDTATLDKTRKLLRK